MRQFPDWRTNLQLRRALPDIDPSCDKTAGMFEGKPPFAREASNCSANPSAGEQLHQLSWSDLVAKLEAARDLCAVLSGEQAPHDTAPQASFDTTSAHHLAEQHEHFPANDKLPVNPLDSGNRKDNCDNKAPSNTEQAEPFRGRT